MAIPSYTKTMEKREEKRTREEMSKVRNEQKCMGGRMRDMKKKRGRDR